MNYSLKSIFLDSNHIGNKGAMAIASSLTVNTTLERLHLRGNLISNNGAIAIANGLKRHYSLHNLCTLNTLLLSRNRIDDVGTAAFEKSPTEVPMLGHIWWVRLLTTTTL